MPGMKTIRSAAILVAGFMASHAMAATLVSFDAQTNPPASNPAELLFNGLLAAGPGSLGNGDGALLAAGLAPGLTLKTPLNIAPGTLGEQNNIDGSTNFYDVTLQLTGLNAAGGAGAGFLVQPLSSGTFLFSSSKVGGGPGVPLLGGSFTNAFLEGAAGSSSGAELSATITYNSGLIYNKLISQGGIATGGNNSISMLNITPALGNAGPSSPLNSFAADANGQFNVSLLPEPASISLLLVAGGALLRRRRA